MVEDHDDLYIKHKLPIQYCCPVHSTSSWKVSPHNLIQISSIAADLSPHIRREQKILIIITVRNDCSFYFLLNALGSTFKSKSKHFALKIFAKLNSRYS